jgi:ATP-dependent DNA helicase PIF1
MKRKQPDELNALQQRALECALDGQNVFLTGPAGTGKSFTLHSIVEQLQRQGKKVALTSSTGISALNINGITIHKWAGIGLGEGDKELLVHKVLGPKRKAWINTNTLILDEISMISDELFEKLDFIGQTIRNDPKPFGGMQIIACGDFYQLPPVKGKYAFQSPIWANTFETSILLTEIFRQSEETLINGLNDMRLGSLDPAFVASMQKDKDAFFQKGNGVLPTCLFALNKNVDHLNESELAKLDSPKQVFTTVDTAIIGKVNDEMFRIPSSITLAVGAQVILLVNKDGYANGTRGVVVAMSDTTVTIKDLHGYLHEIEPHVFESRYAGVLQATRSGLPLKLAWALSIHKSQGCSRPTQCNTNAQDCPLTIST